jgi:phosphopantetheine--protein transferase-like protein
MLLKKYLSSLSPLPESLRASDLSHKGRGENHGESKITSPHVGEVEQSNALFGRGEINLQQTEKGKLFIENSELKFNLAHSHEYAIYAFALNCEVGIDIEQIREVEYDGIAKRIMSKTEYSYWSSFNNDEQVESFFQIWTCKEALIKCTGDGLSGPLKELSTIDSQGNICATVNYANQAQLQLTDLSAPKNYYAALASEQSLQICCYHLLPAAEIFSVGS